jgi:catechol 2,3-dioxygenase-like lactoylglutathione lyase family enzyme
LGVFAAGHVILLGDTVSIEAKQLPVDAAKSVISPAKLAHFVLRTSRYKEIIEWYKIVFGARGVYESDMLSFLTYDDEHHRFAILNVPNLSDQQDGVCGVHHIAFTYRTLNELMSTYERLRDLTITPVYVINHGPTTSLYYADPDGNQLELQVENYESVEASTQFFFSPAFAENPIGVEFDPEDMLKRLQSGQPESELKIRSDVGKRDLSDVKLR